MIKIHDVTKYEPSFNESFFFDNNIWIFLFCPIGNARKNSQKKYSEFLKQIISRNSAIFVNSLILSEFANTYLRIDFNIWKSESKSPDLEYKRDFVGSERFKETVEDVKTAINQILKQAEKSSDNFQAIEIDRVFSEFGDSDFNDSYYIELSQKNDWKIVTDDADFSKIKNHKLEIISGNPNLLNS